jgi:hypothetical protein
MSMTTTTKTTSTRAKIALVPALSFALLGGSMALAAPADATTSRGCTVEPRHPSDLRGNKFDFKIDVRCKDGKTVQIRQLRYEDERGKHDKFLGHSYFTERFGWHANSRTIHSFDRVDHKGSKHVYQLVSFRVEEYKGHWSGWTKWEKSGRY